MGSTGRAIGTLALTVGGSMLGPAGFAVYGAAIGSFIAGIIFAPKGSAQGFRLDNLDIESTEYGFARPQIFGVMQTTASPIDGRYVGNEAKCIEEVAKTTKKGGILGFGGTKVEEFKYYLSASYLVGKGPLIVDKIYFEDSSSKTLIFDRFAATVAKRGYTLTPQSDAGGRVVCELSDGLDLFYGYATQPVSSFLQAQHPGGVPAYRGTSYFNIKHLRLKNGPGKFVVLARSPITGRRQIIERVIEDALIPGGRAAMQGMDEPISSHSTGGGAILSGNGARGEFISQIALLSSNDIGHVDGLLVNRSRLSPLYHVLQLDELGAMEWSGNDGEGATELVKVQPVNVQELPSSLRLEFQDINLNYESNWVRSKRETAAHTNEVTLSLPVASTLQEMQWLCDTLLDEYWAATATVEVQLLPRRLKVAVGDVLLVPDDGDAATAIFHIMRVAEQSISPEGLVQCRGPLYDAGVYGQFRELQNVTLPASEVAVVEAPRHAIFDLPAMNDAMAQGAGYAVAATPPRGTLWAGATFSPVVGDEIALDSAAMLGRVVAAATLLPDSARGFDSQTTLRIEMPLGTLAPVADESVIRNRKANELAINTASGVCVLQFIDAVPVTGLPATWDISGILAGRYGTDYALSIPANAPCVLLRDAQGRETGGLEWVEIPDSEIGRAVSYRVEAGDEIARSDGDKAFTPRANTLLPLSPVRVKLTRSAANFSFSWDARTRLVPGASWAMTRGSDADSFEIRLLQGAVVKLKKTVSTLSAIWTQTELESAFGSPLPASVAGDVCQISARVGRGYARAFTVSLEQ